MNNSLKYRGYLLHFTHYDPRHWAEKKDEVPFSISTAKKIVDTVAENGFNLLLIGVSDGIVYSSHPEFKRHYSQPREQLQELSEYARQNGLEIAPKLNFSQSEINCHNHWMRAPGEVWHTHFDDDYYFQTAFECIDEIIELCQPERFFHLGMDEDHNRSYSQFTSAIRKLDSAIVEHGLKSITWSDSALDYPSGEIYKEKSKTSEKEIKSPLIRLMWNYWAVHEDAARSIIENGHSLWCAPGGASGWETIEDENRNHIASFRDITKKLGGEGIVMTHWRIANKDNEDLLLRFIQELGPLFNQ